MLNSHISATGEQIITKFSTVVTYVKLEGARASTGLCVDVSSGVII